MANRPDTHFRNTLERFRFRPIQLAGDIAQDKTAFLSQLKKTVPAHEVHEVTARPNCLFSLEDGIIYLDWQDRLTTRKTLTDVPEFLEGTHKGATMLRVSERAGIAVTGTLHGEFKVWSLAERRVIAELTTNFRRVERVDIGESGQFFISSQSQLFVLNYRSQTFALINSHKEEVRFELEWLPIEGGEPLCFGEFPH